MNGIGYFNQKTKTDKYAFLMHQCACAYDESLAGSQSITFENAAPMRQMTCFTKGVSAIQLFPMTEPAQVFLTPNRSASEALQLDWCMIGRDMFKVLIKELGDELSRLRSPESRVEPSNPAKTESAFSR